MGNSPSSSTNAFLIVNESNTQIRAGSIITGEIRATASTPVNNYNRRSRVAPTSTEKSSEVTLYFIGKEGESGRKARIKCGVV